jgi:hypothetical protein
LQGVLAWKNSFTEASVKTLRFSATDDVCLDRASVPNNGMALGRGGIREETELELLRRDIAVL